MKVNMEINREINEIKKLAFEKTNKIDKTLPRLREKKKTKLLVPEMKEGISLQISWTLKDKGIL